MKSLKARHLSSRIRVPKNMFAPVKKSVLYISIGTLLLSILTVAPAVPAKADTAGTGSCAQTFTKTGTGTVTVSEVSGRCYIAFRNTGAINTQTSFSLTKPSGLNSLDYLVVAGGGGGAIRHGGGGGAGGLLKGTLSVSSLNALSITVGGGGGGGTTVTASPNNYGPGTTGKDSSLETVVAKGGGGGNTGGAESALAGGSGGGALAVNGGGARTLGQGFAGAGGVGGVSPYSAGGGGGAGSAGTAGSGSTAGAGGSGAVWDSSFTTTIAQSLGWPSTSAQYSGNQVFFAGGGGGGVAGGTAGTASAGGGAGGSSGAGTSGLADSGGGGGGSDCCTSSPGGNGGSGVIVVSYALASQSALSLTSTSGYVGETLSLTTSGGSGTGAVTYAVTTAGTAGCSISGTNLSATSTGTCTVTATKAAADGYSAISSSATTVTVTNPLLAYESFDGMSTPVTGKSGTGSEGFTGNWVTVTSKNDLGTASTSPQSASTSATASDLGRSYTAGIGFALPNTNQAIQLNSSGGGPHFRQAARALSSSISLNSNRTMYMSFLTSGSQQLMAGLLTGLPADSPSDNKFALMAGFVPSGANGQYGIDYGKAYRAAACPDDGTTSCTSTANYTAVSTISGGVAGSQIINGSRYSNFSLVKITASASGNDTIQIKGFPYGTAIPSDDSSITWDATYSANISETFTYLSVQLAGSGYQYMDEVRLGETYTSVVNPLSTSVLTLNPNYAGSTVVTQTVSSGLDTILTPLTRSGYTFNGWNTNADGTSGTNFTASQAVNVASNTTLFAKWTGNTYRYNANTGSNPPADQTFSGTTLVAASGASLVAPTGYVFTGWCTSTVAVGANCGGTSYAAGSNLANPGSATSNLYAIWTPVQTVDSSLVLSGTVGQYGQISVGQILPATSAFTLEAWFKPAIDVSSNTNAVLISQGTGTGRFYLKRLTTGTLVYLRDGGAETNCGTAPADAWSHVAISYSAGTLTCYLNGVQQSTRSASATILPQFVIGDYSATPNQTIHSWKGSIDEVRVYSSVRTSTQIAADAHAYASIDDSTLTAYYDFNEGAGATILNKKAGAAAATNLALSGSPTFADVAETSSVNGRTVKIFKRSYLNNAGGWTVPGDAGTIDVLAVGGGGAGGTAVEGAAGGGGGGRVLTQTNATLSGSLGIQIGRGGAPVTTAGTTPGRDGGTTSVTPTSGTAITALGGGGGASAYVSGTSPQASPSTTGYNGGGGSVWADKFSNGAAGNGGNRGGNAQPHTLPQIAGGGGGAGGAGSDGSAGAGGGLGISNSYATGSSVFYGAGGGGARRNAGTVPTGGSSVGGNGGVDSAGSSATAYSGSGGGGGGAAGATTGLGGFGADGIVVIRYGLESQAALSITSTSGTAGSTLALTTSGGSGSGAVTFAVTTAGTAGCTVSGSTLSFTSAGTCEVTATKAAADGYSAVSSSATTITITSSTYTVTFSYNNATSGNSTTSETFTVGGTAITLPVPTKTGYGFSGWYEDSSFAGSALGLTYSPTQSRTIYAKWAGNKYSYNANTGSNPPADQTFAGTTLTAAASSGVTAPSGYTFGGWCTTQPAVGSACSGTSYAVGDNLPTPSAATVTLYAQWSALTFSYTFDSNSGTSVSGGTFTVGGTLAKPTDPTRTGKYFGGWSTSEASDQGVIANRITSWPYSPSNADLTLYAIWFDDHSLTFAGTNPASARNSAAGQIPTRSSFSWEAWIYPTGVSGTGSTKYATIMDNRDDLDNYGRTWLYVIDAGSGPYISSAYCATDQTCLSMQSNANSIVFNQWQHVAATIDRPDFSGSNMTINLYIDGVKVKSQTLTGMGNTRVLNSIGFAIGDNDDPNQQFKGRIDQVKIWDGALTDAEVIASRSTYSNAGVDNALRAHYGFNELIASPALGNTIDNLASEATTYDLSVYASSSANVTANVSRTQNQFDVSYNGNNSTSGSVTSETGVLPYGSVTLASGSTLSRTGYEFAGWNTNSSGTGTNYAVGDSYQVLYGNKTVYAKWTASTNTVTFKSNYTGGPSDITQTITSDTATALRANTFTRAGYLFAGWTANADGTGTSYTNEQSVSIAGALTLHAKWTANTNTVTYNSKGGSSVANGSFVTGGSIASAPTPPTRTGYSFDGWTATDGGSTVISFPYSPGATSGITLYAKWTENTYTITYNVNGATGSPERATDTYTYTSGAVTLANVGSMAKTGYRFDGWQVNGTTTKLSSTYTPSANVTLEARWNAASYTITYFSNSGGTAPNADTYTTGNTALTLPTQGSMVRTGYTFNGWSTTINDVSTKIANSQSSATLTTTAPVNLFALWTAVDYNITYSNENSTGGSVPTDTTDYNIGDTLIVKANSGTLVRTGYSFAGWTLTSGGSGTAYQSGDTYTVGSADLTFYPKWTANTYNISYNTNGASGTPARTSDTYTTAGSTISLPNVGTMTKTGYNFAGWSTSSTGSVHSGAFTTSSDVTLFAIWTIKSIDYSYDRGAAGGVNLTNMETTVFPNTSQQSAQYNTSITLSSNVDSTITVGSDSYKFYGWYDGNTTYAAGTSFVMPDAPQTFTAQWAKLYGVRYSLNGGSGVLARDTECLESGYTCVVNQSITLSDAPTRDGYTFAGWRNQANTETKLAGASVTVTDTSYLWYAQWTPIPYSITFNSVGGSLSPAAQTKNIGDAVTLPDPGTKTGYTFDGWLISSTSYGQGTTFTVGTSNVAFTAVWTANRYNVSYNWNGGSGSGSSGLIYTVGTTPITLPTGNARDGYVFDGWQVSGTTTKLSSTYAPTADTLLEARWIDGAYTLTFDNFNGSSNTTASVTRATATTLPTPTRTGFTFDGWYEDAGYTLRYGAGGASVVPTTSKALTAKWVQNSLTGINPAHLNALATLNIAGGTSGSWTGNHTQSGTGATLTVPAGALPNGTEVKVSFVEDLTRPASLIENNNAYFTSVVVHWITGTGNSATVPTAAANKPLVLRLENPAIVAGAKVFSILAGQVTEVATATVDGEVTLTFYDDPEFVVAATRPGSPTAVTATNNQNAQSLVSWNAPLGNGGSAVTGYTVTASPGGATCSTTGTSCQVTGLTNGTSYTFTVTATNAIGTSIASAPSSAITPRLAVNYTVTFNSNGGSSVGNGSFVENGTLSAPTDPTRSGYNFIGWATTDGNESTIVSFPYSPSNANLTLYAIWRANNSAQNPANNGAVITPVSTKTSKATPKATSSAKPATSESPSATPEPTPSTPEDPTATPEPTTPNGSGAPVEPTESSDSNGLSGGGLGLLALLAVVAAGYGVRRSRRKP